VHKEVIKSKNQYYYTITFCCEIISYWYTVSATLQVHRAHLAHQVLPELQVPQASLEAQALRAVLAFPEQPA